MLTFSRVASIEFKQRLRELVGNAANFIEIKIVLTRSTDTARKCFRDRAVGTEKTSILITKEAAKFKPLTVHILPSYNENAIHCFRGDKTDTCSSNYFDNAATEIPVQRIHLGIKIKISYCQTDRW